MAVLEKIRVKLGVFITVIIAVALLSFIIDPSTLDMVMRSFSSKYDVGEIKGKGVKYEDYQKKVEYFTNVYSMQTGNQSPDEQALESIYASAWQELQNEILIIPAIKKAGVKLGEEELLDLTQGQEISPVILNESSFRDASGEFSRAQFLQFIQAIPTDQSGRLAQYWNFLEESMEDQQYFAKYMSLFSKSDIQTPVEKRRAVEENNTIYNTEFVVYPYGFQVDTTIVVSDAEIKEYYNKNIDKFEQKAARDIEFVVYEVVPSESDFEDAKNSIDKLFTEFSNDKNAKGFVTRNSDLPFNPYFFKQGELATAYPQIDEFAFGGNAPEVLPVFLKDEQYLTARVNAVKTMSDSAFVQHILLPPGETAKADSLLAIATKKGTNFSELAAENTLDKNPNVANPGDIGWMTQSMMIPGFEEVLTSAAGKISVIESQYGVHVVKVVNVTKPLRKVQLAILAKDVVASEQTYQTYYAKANDLASRSEGKVEKFDEITQAEKLAVVPVSRIAEGAKKISIHEKAVEISRWAYEAKKGDVSPIITVDNNKFFVVALKEVYEEGVAPLAQVSPQIEFMVSHEKRKEKMTKEVAEKIKGLTSMEAIAEALNTTVSKKSDVAFGSLNTQSTDPVLIGTIASLETNTISQPVAGNVGVYVVNVLGKDVGSFYTEEDAKSRQMQRLNYQLGGLPAIFTELGEVVDNRARFF